MHAQSQSDKKIEGKKKNRMPGRLAIAELGGCCVMESEIAIDQ